MQSSITVARNNTDYCLLPQQFLAKRSIHRGRATWCVPAWLLVQTALFLANPGMIWLVPSPELVYHRHAGVEIGLRAEVNLMQRNTDLC